jgi:hypothetical protein
VDLIGRELVLLSVATEQTLEWPETARFDRPRERLLDELCNGDSRDQFACLLELTHSLADAAKRLSDAIGLRFFSHSETFRSQIL